MTVGVPPDDRGLLLGDGLFETVRADRGTLLNFDAHLRRLARGCLSLGLPVPAQERLMEAAQAAITEAGLDQALAAVRLSWSAGSGGRGLDRPPSPEPRLWCAASPISPTLAPARLAIASIRRNERSPTSRVKSLSYLDNVLARAEAAAVGADEALMLNTQGQLACAAAANLFWIAQGRLFTPSLDCGVLDGTVRAALLARAPSLGLEALEVAQGPAALETAGGVFLTNSLIGVRAVSALDGRTLPVPALIAALAGLCTDLLWRAD